MNLARPQGDNKEEKEKKGAGAPWLLGAPSSSSGGFSYQLGTLADIIARSTGISTIAATKWGAAALALSAGTIAIAVSLLVHTRSSPEPMPAGQFVFEQRGQEDAARTQADAPAQVQPSALDYFSSANPISSQLADVSEPKPAPAAPPWREVIKQSAPKAAAKPAGKAENSKLKLSKGAPGSASGGGTAPTFKTVPSLSGKVGSDFQEIYRRASGAFTASRAMDPGARKNMGALLQAKAVDRVSRLAAGTGQNEAAAAAADAAFDASNRQAHALGMTANGLGSIYDKANSAPESEQVSPPPPPPPVDNPKNKTPYQGLIMAGMAALMTGQMMVMAAGQMVSSAQSNPAAAPDLLSAAKAMAVAAMGAGGSAGAIGGALSGQYNQGSQAIPYIVGGAVIAAQAAIVLVQAEAAGQQAEEGVSNAADQGAAQAAQALQPPQMPMSGDNSNQDSKPKPTQPKQTGVNKQEPPQNVSMTGPSVPN